MKKRTLISLALAVLLLCGLACSAFATQAQLYYVTDEAGLFTEEERETLENRAETLSEQYSFGIYIVILPDYQDYTFESSIERFAVSFYDEYDLGWGSDNAGTMLMLSMEERDYDLDFSGRQGSYAFTEAGRDKLLDRVLRYFRKDDFYGGFTEYLDVCEEYLLAAQQGSPVGEGEKSSYESGYGDVRPLGEYAVIAAVAGVIVAVLTGICASAPMRSAKEKRDADQYVAHGGLNLRRRSDMFLRRSVSRRPRQTESPRGGGPHGGGSHGHSYSSGGHSWRSGKF